MKAITLPIFVVALVLSTSYSVDAGYADGMNQYAGYHVMHGGLDPMGTKLVYVEVLNEDNSGDDTPQYGDLPAGSNAQQIKKYPKMVDGFIENIEAIGDGDFDRSVAEGKVSWAGQAFNGTKAEYIERLKREKTSVAVVQNYGTLDDAIKKLNELAGDDVRDYDHIVIAAHGLYSELGDQDGDGIADVPTQWSGQIGVNGQQVDQKQAISQIQEGIKDIEATATIASCGQKDYWETLGIGGYSRGIRPGSSDGKRIYTITFTPIQARVQHRKTNDPNSPVIDPATGEPIQGDGGG